MMTTSWQEKKKAYELGKKNFVQTYLDCIFPYIQVYK